MSHSPDGLRELVHETIVNDRISQFLSKEFSIDSRAERTTTGKRPDIIITHKGLLIGIESSFSRSDAENDAIERMSQRRADMVLALWLKDSYFGLGENELDQAIRESRFDVKVFTPLEESFDKYLSDELKTRRSAEGWYADIGLSDLKEFIDSAPDFLVKEETIAKLTDKIKEETYYFVRSLSSLDRNGEYAERFYRLFWRLYGLSLGRSPSEISDVIFGQVALSILLSSAFYEHARDFNPKLESLNARASEDPIKGLKEALEDLLEKDYKVALGTTLEILNMIPSGVSNHTGRLCQLGTMIAENRALLKRDFAGRIYHQITGDLALKKGLATFYTEIPSAYLLAGLSLNTLLGRHGPEDQAKLLGKILIGDFACGSGTLLTASVHTLDRTAARLRFYDKVEIDLDASIQRIIENGVFGIDVLRYAAQITAINLALMSSQNLSKQNVFTVHLGFDKGHNFTWLGSLELLNDHERFAGLLAWIEGGLKGAAERISVERVGDDISLPDKFDLITMNPPFTRATGRSKKLEPDRNSFFGFIADEEARQKVKDSYEAIRDKVRTSLTEIAQECRDFPHDISEIAHKTNGDLEQYLGVGQAGEGLVFLYLAYRLVKQGGVIAFVLPRSILSGVHWYLARALLVSKFRLRYVITSGDPKGYNFSESTSLSEVLLVAERTDQHTRDEETVFVNLLLKPNGALDSITLVDRIEASIRKGIPFVYGKEGISAVLNRIRRTKLLENLDNLNRFIAVSDVNLSNEIIGLVEDELIHLDKSEVSVKLTKFTNLIETIGVNRRGDMIEAFGLPVKGGKVDFSKLVTKLPNSYPMVGGGGSGIRKRMLVEPNAHVLRATKVSDRIIPLMSRLLIPYRIRWNTVRMTAMCSKEPVLSNMFFMTKLNVHRDRLIDAEKALTVWLNSIWGILVILANREDTEGAFTGLNIGNWRLLPVLDVASLKKSVLTRLSKVFDRVCDNEFPRLPEQFSDDPKKVCQARLELDSRVLFSLEPKLDHDEVTRTLLKLYGRLDQALKSWIGNDGDSVSAKSQLRLGSKEEKQA